MGQRASVYLDDLHAAAEASGVPPAELLRRGLADEAQTGASLPTVTARGRTTREIRLIVMRGRIRTTAPPAIRADRVDLRAPRAIYSAVRRSVAR
jgi:hypothetical protein